MSGKKSKDKGRNYELSIAKAWSEYTGLEIIRTPMSGAWAGTSGDLLPKNREQNFPFVIECKKQEDWNLFQVIKGEGEFYKWVDQVISEVRKDLEITKQERFPLVMFSKNYQPDFIACPALRDFDVYGFRQQMLVDIGGAFWIVVEWEQFKEHVTYNDLLDLIAKQWFKQSNKAVDAWMEKLGG